MTKIRLQGLSPVSETLLLPLYWRAAESQRPDAVLKDDKALELVNALDYDFAQLKGQAFDQLTTAMRSRQFDRCAHAFLAQHPHGVVVQLGCGLDTRFYRVDNGAVQWYDLDLPEVIAFRRQLLPETERCRFLASSALDYSWMDAVGDPAGRAFLFLAEGVLMYLEPAQVRDLVLALRDRFPASELMFDALSPLAIWIHRLNPAVRKVAQQLHWALRDHRELERWGAGIRLLNAWSYFEEPEPRLGWARLLRLIPLLRNEALILHYRLQ